MPTPMRSARRYETPALRTDFAMWEQYRFETGLCLTIPITAFGGDRNGRAPVAALTAWRHHTDGAFTR